MDTYYGTLLVQVQDKHPSFCFGSNSVCNNRAMSSVRWFRTLYSISASFAEELGDGALYLQFDDYSHNDLPSVAYGKRAASDPLVRLIPDTYFFERHGYQATRDAATRGELPPWAERIARVFWRGSASHDMRSPTESRIREPCQVPRVVLCQRLMGNDRADAGVVPWVVGTPDPGIVGAYIHAEGLYKPLVPMAQHALYKLQIDIDGFANAWGFLDKLLMGSCIMKVDTVYRQWFYDELTPWIHFVPVRADLEDLEEKLDWCLSHDLEAEEIGRHGQALALKHSFAYAAERALEAINEAFIPL